MKALCFQSKTQNLWKKSNTYEKNIPPVRLLFHRFTMKQIIRKSALLCLTAGLLTSVASAQTAIYIDNAGFELPNTTKISGGWDVSGANDVDRKSTRLNSSHRCISYAVFCLK